MKRGEVWWVNFDPSVGGEIKKIRPALIISNDVSNKIMNRIQVVPISSKVTKCFPCEAYVMVKDSPGKAMADQMTTASKTRFKNRICTLTEQEIFGVEQAVKIQLDL